MQAGLVSVMMPAYNAAGYIEEAVRSMLAQTYSHWELLVVNDGSTDATADVVRQFHDPRIRLLNKKNGGESTARNMALEHSRGEFIAYLDADDAYLPHHLAVTIGFLNSHPDRDAVYTDGIHIDEHGNRLTSLQSRRRGPFEGRLFEHAVRASDIFGPPLCVVLRHDVVARHRLRYDPRIVIGPDWDFFIRVTDLATFGYLDDRTCLYRVHQTNISTRVDSKKRLESLAICREKAIKHPKFGACSTETQVAVFYDLLIDWLRDEPARRSEATRWAEFARLPRSERARLLRLMASDALVRGKEQVDVADWLRRATELNPADRRAHVLAGLYRLSPRLCRAVLRTKSPGRATARDAAPFADLVGKRMTAVSRPT
jgi:glycosyltransferase involved in cell wall biosynthesis